MSNKLAKIMLILVLLLLLVMDLYVVALPGGADIIFNETNNITPQAGTALATAGGSFTTLVLNVTQQNPRWKAYVGNVTGQLVLQDSNNISIYDWAVVTITGEVFASRSNDISWDDIQCLSNAVLLSEEIAMNITTSAVDSINSTFSMSKHASFLVGSTLITNSTCKAVATYINDAAQTESETADFQEILLDDTTNLVYATILEQNAAGYDNSNTYDFQMIIAENEYTPTPTTYYFYAEIG